jgi:hypothetical protein
MLFYNLIQLIRMIKNLTNDLGYEYDKGRK